MNNCFIIFEKGAILTLNLCYTLDVFVNPFALIFLVLLNSLPVALYFYLYSIIEHCYVIY